jgi:hypothetical protein
VTAQDVVAAVEKLRTAEQSAVVRAAVATGQVVTP